MHSVSLIAEDSQLITQLLRKYAEPCGFRVIHVAEGENVLAATQEIIPVFVLINTNFLAKCGDGKYYII